MRFQKTALHKVGFPPIAQADSRLLLLGSMPGEQSLAQQEYYAHPRNLFWTFIAALGDQEEVPADYKEKRALLQMLRIALWDVCGACIREGSLDTAIVQEIPNEIDRFLSDHPMINAIAFNGQKAAALYRKYFKPRAGITYITLPSTSPANAGISTENKKNAWLKLRDTLA